MRTKPANISKAFIGRMVRNARTVKSMNVTKVGGKTARPGLYMCNACRKHFTVTVGTIFEDSKIPLNKWLLAFRLLNGGKKGFSAHELHRHLGITYKSAWFMAHRIREAMKDRRLARSAAPARLLRADETFVGGKKNRACPASVAPKKKVVTLVERGGRARSFHITNINAQHHPRRARDQRRPRVAPNDRRRPLLQADWPRVRRVMARRFTRAASMSRGEVHS